MLACLDACHDAYRYDRQVPSQLGTLLPLERSLLQLGMCSPKQAMSQFQQGMLLSLVTLQAKETGYEGAASLICTAAHTPAYLHLT